MELLLLMLPFAVALPLGASRAEGAAPQAEPARMYRELASFIRARIGEFDEIDGARRARLEAIAEAIGERVGSARPARLTFICTHNSRRSHLAQAWAWAAAAHYGIPGIQTYSGGTESTAFNPRAVEALRRAGFRVDGTAGDRNPKYRVRFHDEAAPATHFSKVYDRAPNPKDGFLAVMVCADADEACPVVSGAEERFTVTYVDPKALDGTTMEAAAYDERCRQIAREMLYVFSRVRR